MALLEETHWLHPADRDVLMALVSIARDRGNFAAALGHATDLSRSLRLWVEGARWSRPTREWLHRVDCHLRRMLRGRQGCSDTGPSDKRTVELFYNTSTTVCRGMEPRGEENDGRQKNCDEPCHIGGAVAIGRGKSLVTFISRILTLYLK